MGGGMGGPEADPAPPPATAAPGPSRICLCCAFCASSIPMRSVSIMMGGGPAYMYGARALEAYDQFSGESTPD